MQIELKEITIRELSEGYANNAEDGVVGYNGDLDIRPPYQREFIYNDKQRDAVIDTVRNGFPLNVMYWAVRDDGGYEIIDGQQRTISICEYVVGDFSINAMTFDNLPDDKKDAILDYVCRVYFCSGTDSEKLAWFKTINIAGEKLTDQELRNAVYHGPWTADVKIYFSKRECDAFKIGHKYVTGSSIRQDYLETAIKWHLEVDGDYGDAEDPIAAYMSSHKRHKSGTPLWTYFKKVIKWVQDTFPDYRSEMRYVQWGPLFNKFTAGQLYKKELDKDELAADVSKYMKDEEVTKKSGIYPYVLTRDEKWLNLRAFSDNVKREAYERQKGICKTCKKKFEESEMEADHIIPWSKGGKTIASNCKMLCKADNREKSDD